MNSSQSCPECELKETCSFYWNYRDHPSIRDGELLERYCLAPSTTNGCERISYYLRQGDFPPANLAPDGSRISVLIRTPAG